MLHLTPSAIKEIKRLQRSRQQPDTILELRVSSGGCSGLFYQLNLASCPDFSASETNSTGDRYWEKDGIKILIKSASWKYLENLKIDYAEDLMGGGFRFNNPLAKKVCGCGISFVPTTEI